MLRTRLGRASAQFTRTHHHAQGTRGSAGSVRPHDLRPVVCAVGARCAPCDREVGSLLQQPRGLSKWRCTCRRATGDNACSGLWIELPRRTAAQIHLDVSSETPPTSAYPATRTTDQNPKT